MSDPSPGPPVSIALNPALSSSAAPWSQCHVCRNGAQAAQAQVGSFPEGEVRMITVRAHGAERTVQSASSADDPWRIAAVLSLLHEQAGQRFGAPPGHYTTWVQALLTNYIGERHDYKTHDYETPVAALRRIIAERDAAQGVPSTLPEE